MKTQVTNSAKKIIVSLVIVLAASVMTIANAQGISDFMAMLSSVDKMNSTNVEEMAVLESEELSDSELKVEDWMSNDNYWKVNEQDKDLEVENWMSNENYWGVEEQARFSDSPLAVENWMSSDAFWTGGHQEKDDNLAVENWMASNDYWGVK